MDHDTPYILVSLGTDEHPFERALDLVADLRPTHRLTIQHGHTPPRDWAEAAWLDFVPFEALRDLMSDADAVVCHAGVGTIMTALSFGRRPVVIPRRAANGEHVDDHQLQIVAKLSERGFVVPVTDEGGIVAAVEQARLGTVEWRRESGLAQAVVAAVEGRD